MEKYLDTKIIVSVIVAGLVVGLLVRYGSKIPAIGDTVASAAELAK